MAQIQKGDTFTNGQQVTATRLNQLVESAVLLVGSISEQTAMTSNTLEATDEFAVNDSGTLKKAKIGDILNSNLPVTSSSATLEVVNAPSGKDNVVTTNNGTAVTSKAFTSSDGLNVTVTSVAHGLIANSIISVTASNTEYSGTFKIASVTADTFIYQLLNTATTFPTSGTVSYTRKGSLRVSGSVVSTENGYFDGSLKVAGPARLGATRVDSLLVGAKTPMLVEDSQSKVYVKVGVASGATGAGADNLVYQTPTLSAIPADETWIYEVLVQTTSGYVNGNTRADYASVSLKVYNNATLLATINGSTSPYGGHTATHSYAKSFTSADNGAKLILKTYNWWGLNEEPRYTIRLSKVKTSTLSDASSCI